MLPNQLPYDTAFTPAVLLILSMYEMGSKEVKDTAFRVMRRIVHDALIPSSQALTPLLSRPKANIASVTLAMVRPVRSLCLKAFLKISLRRSTVFRDGQRHY